MLLRNMRKYSATYLLHLHNEIICNSISMIVSPVANTHKDVQKASDVLHVTIMKVWLSDIPIQNNLYLSYTCLLLLVTSLFFLRCADVIIYIFQVFNIHEQLYFLYLRLIPRTSLFRYKYYGYGLLIKTMSLFDDIKIDYKYFHDAKFIPNYFGFRAKLYILKSRLTVNNAYISKSIFNNE